MMRTSHAEISTENTNGASDHDTIHVVSSNLTVRFPAGGGRLPVANDMMRMSHPDMSTETRNATPDHDTKHTIISRNLTARLLGGGDPLPGSTLPDRHSPVWTTDRHRARFSQEGWRINTSWVAETRPMCSEFSMLMGITLTPLTSPPHFPNWVDMRKVESLIPARLNVAAHGLLCARAPNQVLVDEMHPMGGVLEN